MSTKKIDMKLLFRQLAGMEESCVEFTPVSDYVMEHIFKPLLADQEVSYAELDFTRFSGSDIDDLENMLEERERQKNRLEQLNLVFCAAEPISVKRRAFC